MGAKTKGTGAERELVHLFWKKDWAASRVAGSGSIKYPVPDIIAGKDKRVLAIECKTTKDDCQYLTKEEVDDLRKFAKITGAEPYVAVRFAREEWRFLHPDELDVTVSQFVVSKKLATEIGKRLDEVTGATKGI
ncbi:MAG: Holliday junction resolvase Hjc [Candidatus Woesearchaeota archaeon]